jgi:hypothetical protein
MEISVQVMERRGILTGARGYSKPTGAQRLGRRRAPWHATCSDPLEMVRNQTSRKEWRHAIVGSFDLAVPWTWQRARAPLVTTLVLATAAVAKAAVQVGTTDADAGSPSGLSLDDTTHVFHQAVVGELTQGQHRWLGGPVLAAQQDHAASGAFPEFPAIHNLIR